MLQMALHGQNYVHRELEWLFDDIDYVFLF